MNSGMRQGAKLTLEQGLEIVLKAFHVRGLWAGDEVVRIELLEGNRQVVRLLTSYFEGLSTGWYTEEWRAVGPVARLTPAGMAELHRRFGGYPKKRAICRFSSQFEQGRMHSS